MMVINYIYINYELNKQITYKLWIIATQQERSNLKTKIILQGNENWKTKVYRTEFCDQMTSVKQLKVG